MDENNTAINNGSNTLIGVTQIITPSVGREGIPAYSELI
jgi:hypothetical protein